MIARWWRRVTGCPDEDLSGIDEQATTVRALARAATKRPAS